jgi:hypothetical protein
MAQKFLNDDQFIQSVTYTLPNKHYIPVPMDYIGLDNLTPCVPSSFFCLKFPSVLSDFLLCSASCSRCTHQRIRRMSVFRDLAPLTLSTFFTSTSTAFSVRSSERTRVHLRALLRIAIMPSRAKMQSQYQREGEGQAPSDYEVCTCKGMDWSGTFPRKPWLLYWVGVWHASSTCMLCSRDNEGYAHYFFRDVLCSDSDPVTVLRHRVNVGFSTTISQPLRTSVGGDRLYSFCSLRGRRSLFRAVDAYRATI